VNAAPLDNNSQPTMPDAAVPGPGGEMSPAAGMFYSGAPRRIERLMVVLGVAATVGLLVLTRWQTALGFAGGGLLAFWNFRSLERAVTALGGALTGEPSPRSRPRVVLRFFARYLLMALAAYVIFKSYPASLYGLLAGLFLPVAAIFGEAIFEAVAAVRKGL
jgi:hypothetical protein